VQAARDHVSGDKSWVADVGLAKFFDRVNHDVQMARVDAWRARWEMRGCSASSAGSCKPV
jgi:hypothetical protein